MRGPGLRSRRSASLPLQGPAVRSQVPRAKDLPGLPPSCVAISGVFILLNRSISRAVLDCLSWLGSGRAEVSGGPASGSPARRGFPASPRDPEMASHTQAGGRDTASSQAPHCALPCHGQLRETSSARKPNLFLSAREKEREREEKNWPDRGPGLLSHISCPAHPAHGCGGAIGGPLAQMS